MIVDVPANSPCTVSQRGERRYQHLHAHARPQGHQGVLPGRPVERLPQLPERPRPVPGAPRRLARSTTSTICTPTSGCTRPTATSRRYLDSQAIGPGASFTAEIVYNGSGNRNLTVGDSIFHCHFYPHFAQGMWALWRVHDVFETGTPLDADGRPAGGPRACRTARSSPARRSRPSCRCPASAMAPIPARVSIVNGQVQIAGAGNPGYPFFVPGPGGAPAAQAAARHDRRRRPAAPHHHGRHLRRGPHPPRLPQGPAHRRRAGARRGRQHRRAGAMAFHAQPATAPACRTASATGGTPVRFITNGLPPIAGAPYADPCDHRPGEPARYDRLYKAADIQDDVKINKKGWHFPQQRISALWDDVDDYLLSTAPEAARAALLPGQQQRLHRVPAHQPRAQATTSWTTSRCARPPTSWASTSTW